MNQDQVCCELTDKSRGNSNKVNPLRYGHRLFSAIFLVVLWVQVLPVYAAQAEGLNVVLLMDSSGSMRKNDPQELRKPASKLFVSLLGKEDNVAIVKFSDTGEVLVPLVPAKDKASQQKLFGAISTISSDGAHTNIKNAIDAAIQVIESGPKASKSIIVLMSDGQMDPGTPELAAQLTNQLFDQTVKRLNALKIETHTIAFTDQSDKNLLEKLSYATTGKFNIARHDKELHQVFSDIFEQNKAPDMVPFEGGKFAIDSAISEVTVLGSKTSDTVILALQTPSGQRMTAKSHPSNVKWMESSLFDLITITKPEAGDWILQSSDNKNKAYILTDLKLQVTPSKTTALVGQEIDVASWLENEGKVVEQQPVLATLTVNMMLQGLDGKWYEVPITAEVTELQMPTGKYLSRLTLPGPGKFHIRVVAATPTFSREKSVVIDVPRDEVVAAIHPEKVKKHPATPAKEKSHDPQEGTDYLFVGGVFLGINLLLAAVIGAAIVVRKRRRAKPPEEAAV